MDWFEGLEPLTWLEFARCTLRTRCLPVSTGGASRTCRCIDDGGQCENQKNGGLNERLHGKEVTDTRKVKHQMLILYIVCLRPTQPRRPDVAWPVFEG